MTQLRKLTVTEIIRAVREVIQDVNPAGCFKISRQGFLLSVTTTELTLTESASGTEIVLPFETYPTLADLVYQIQVEGDFVLSFSEDYLGTEPSTSIIPVANKDITQPFELRRYYYFSPKTVEEQMMEFLLHKLGYGFGVHTSRSVESWVDSEMDYTQNQRMILWVAFWLLDKQRMALQATMYLRRKSGEISDAEMPTLANVDVTERMKIGDTFERTEQYVADGSGAEGMTNLWGDKYSFLSKLQLWVRSRLEKMFNDYSLRDDNVHHSTFYVQKQWSPSAYYKKGELSPTAAELLLRG